MITLDLSFENSRAARISGTDLGHVKFTSKTGEWHSHDKRPSQAMMLVPSLTLLLDGLRAFLASGEKRYLFSAVGSSFQVVFERDGKGRVQVSGGGKVLDRATPEELARSLYAPVHALGEALRNRLPTDDPMHDDLYDALESFRTALKL